MTDSLDSGRFKIVSLSQGDPPIGVNRTRPAWQTVSVNGPVQEWVLRKVGKGQRYLLSIGGYPYTGVLDGRVIASTHPEHEAEWEIIRREHQEAFTIALANDPHLGWTVPINLADRRGVQIKTITATHSIPPHFLPSQLFSIRQDD